MSAIITDKFRLQQAKDYLENFVDADHTIARNHYLFVARSRPWPTDLINNINENSPPVPIDSVSSEFDIWDSILSFKKVKDVYTSLVIPRFNWDGTGDTIYKPYDDQDGELFLHPTDAEKAAASMAGSYTAGSVYIMTDQYHVFKCLNNNNNSKSTIKPTLPLSAPYIVSTADGYQWKYMCSVSPAQVEKFLSENWIPVHTLGDIADDGSTQWDVEQTAINGSIDAFIIENQGSGYVNVYSGQLVSAGASSAVLPAGASAITGTYVGESIFITAGTGFPSSPRKILTYDGPSRTAGLDDTWTADATTQFEIWPSIDIAGNGINATAKLVVYTTGPDLGKIQEVVVTNNGTGYTNASATISGGGGTGGVVRPVVSPKFGNGHDVERELGAFFGMLDLRLAYNEGAGDFPVANDYRIIGLVRDLLNTNGTLASADTRIGTQALNLTGVSDGIGGPFQPDEDVIGVLGPTIAQGKVVEFFAGPGPGQGIVHFWQDSGTGYNTFVDGMIVTGQISGATGTIDVAGLVDREVRKNSGDVIYFENRRPVVRDPAQTEQIKILIEF